MLTGIVFFFQLYEAMLSENEVLRSKLKKTEDELTDCKLRLSDSSKNSVSNVTYFLTGSSVSPFLKLLRSSIVRLAFFCVFWIRGKAHLLIT